MPDQAMEEERDQTRKRDGRLRRIDRLEECLAGVEQQKRARTAGSAAACQEPTTQVAQCVVDLMWQARSWWPNGSAAART
jgi:hypothetical protein